MIYTSQTDAEIVKLCDKFFFYILIIIIKNYFILQSYFCFYHYSTLIYMYDNIIRIYLSFIMTSNCL